MILRRPKSVVEVTQVFLQCPAQHLSVKLCVTVVLVIFATRVKKHKA